MRYCNMFNDIACHSNLARCIALHWCGTTSPHLSIEQQNFLKMKGARNHLKDTIQPTLVHPRIFRPESCSVQLEPGIFCNCPWLMDLNSRFWLPPPTHPGPSRASPHLCIEQKNFLKMKGARNHLKDTIQPTLVHPRIFRPESCSIQLEPGIFCNCPWLMDLNSRFWLPPPTHPGPSRTSPHLCIEQKNFLKMKGARNHLKDTIQPTLVHPRIFRPESCSVQLEPGIFCNCPWLMDLNSRFWLPPPTHPGPSRTSPHLCIEQKNSPKNEGGTKSAQGHHPTDPCTPKDFQAWMLQRTWNALQLPVAHCNSWRACRTWHVRT